MTRRRRARGLAPIRPPWWLLVLAAAFLLHFAVLLQAEWSRDAPMGALIEPAAGGLVVSGVVEGSPAQRAGLQAGDRIVRYAGRGVVTRLDWAAVSANLAPGEPVALDIVRGGEPRSLTVTLGRHLRWPPALADVVLGLSRLAQAVCLLLAVAVIVRRPHDHLARLGALLLAALGVFTIVMPQGFAHAWRQVPVALQPLLWVANASAIAAPALFFAFCAAFPEPLVRRRVTWFLSSVPAIGVLAWHLAYLHTVVTMQGRVPVGRDLSVLVIVASVGYAVAGLAALGVQYRRLEGAVDRRRLRVLIAGTATGCAAGALIALPVWVRPGTSFAQSLFASPLTLVGVPLLLAFPGSLAYTIVRSRLFDLRLIVRQGVRYAMARRLLLALVPLLLLVVAGDLYAHRTHAIAEVARTRGWLYAAAGTGILVTLARRQQWLDALDRRFFRDRYEAERVLLEVASQLGRTESAEAAVALVVEQVARAVQPTFVATLRSGRHDETLTVESATPDAPASLALPATSKMLALAGAVGAPLELSPDRDAWIARHLPAEEAAWVVEHQVELLVPVTHDAPPRTVLVLGARRSEEPYSRRDLDLLQAIAANLALVLARALPPGATAGAGTTEGEEPALAECPACARCFDTTLARCPDDGALLLASDLPAVLGGRYRLVERLGAGGMGTVYAAHDEALDRVVAVKVLAPHLVGSPGAAQRFQREARTAAGFTHPHVVTIHDFGVTGRGRAFLVMERLEGSTLRDAIACEGGLARDEACRIVSEVCEVLEAAHARGLVHRDLKPENIFLARTGREERVVKVLDFGIAKAVAQATDAPTATASGVIVGSLPYMAPEQWRGEPVDHRWDLWALAVVAFEMLTGTRPIPPAPRRSPRPPARGLSRRIDSSPPRLHRIRTCVRRTRASSP